MAEKRKNTNPLWTKDFTILTIGSVVSMIGSAISGFAIGLMVLDYTGSTFLFALSMVAYNLPKIIMPTLAGPYLDRYSRRKVIYTLDFISTGIYLGLFFMMRADMFSYAIFIALSVVMGAIESVYEVAYESFYPTLISEGNYSRAYSVSSMIYPLAAIMTPVAAIIYEKIGLAPLFLFNSASYLIAAICETRIKAVDKHLLGRRSIEGKYSLSDYWRDFRYGLDYIKNEDGLKTIVTYFSLTALFYATTETLYLPYFKSTPQLGAVIYSVVMAFGVAGRLAGGLIQYKFKYPPQSRFLIALIVYFATSALEGAFLFVPIAAMAVLQFISGILGVTSYNIRISATQSYLPENVRGRFNGTFQMLFTLGTLLGELIAGILGEIAPIRTVALTASLINIIFVYTIIYRGRESVKKIYNTDI